MFGADHAEICGAFKAAGRHSWSLYVTMPVAKRAGRSPHGTPPPHLRLCTREHARQWVEFIAGLYVSAQRP